MDQQGNLTLETRPGSGPYGVDDGVKACMRGKSLTRHVLYSGQYSSFFY